MQNMGISKWLGGFNNSQSWSSKCKQVLNAMILWHKIQNKKMMRYLYKQKFCVSYMGIGRQSKKWENDILMERLAQSPNWRESPNPYPCILTSSNLFQPNAQESTFCPNDGTMCKSVETAHPSLSEEISPYSIGKWKGPPSFTEFADD